jgi:hypothetical protein
MAQLFLSNALGPVKAVGGSCDVTAALNGCVLKRDRKLGKARALGFDAKVTQSHQDAFHVVGTISPFHFGITAPAAFVTKLHAEP